MQFIVIFSKKYPFFKIKKKVYQKQTLTDKINKVLDIILGILRFVIIFLLFFFIFYIGYMFYLYKAFYIKNARDLLTTHTSFSLVTIQLGDGSGQQISFSGENTTELKGDIKYLRNNINFNKIFQTKPDKKKINLCVYKTDNFMTFKAYTSFSSYMSYLSNKGTVIKGLTVPKSLNNKYLIPNLCDYTIILMRWSDENTFYHEFGHFVNFYLYDNNQEFRQEFNTIWSKYFSESQKLDFVRPYGATNELEDRATIFRFLVQKNILNNTYLLNKKTNFMKKWIY